MRMQLPVRAKNFSPLLLAATIALALAFTFSCSSSSDSDGDASAISEISSTSSNHPHRRILQNAMTVLLKPISVMTIKAITYAAIRN